MREIGGYFGLECGRKQWYHVGGRLLNSGRSALRLAIRTYGIKKLYLPFYTCPVVWEAAKNEGCECVGYEIGMDFMPKFEFTEGDFILYNNYFGICARQVDRMAARYPNLIVDNAQAFYMSMRGIASIYSPRKFFGVPDGGILLSKQASTMPEEYSVSWSRCSHLLKRWDLGAEAGYEDFQKNGDSLTKEGVLRMSRLTQALMGNIDYGRTKKQRLENFRFLHAKLKTINQLNIRLTDEDVPMVYPFLCEDLTLRKRLIDQKIFVAKYWPGGKNDYMEGLVALPIDQRYRLEDMEIIMQVIGN